MSKLIKWQAVRKDLRKFLAMENDFIENFKHARSCCAKLKKSATAAVVRSEWFTGLHHELDPTFFTLGLREGKPVRQLKREPVSKMGIVCYGYDSGDRLVHTEKCMAWDEYRVHMPGRIDATRYHRWEKNCLDIQTLFLDEGLPIAHMEFDGNWLEIKKYEFKGGKIIRAFIASKHIAATDSEWCFRKCEILEKRHGIYHICITGENLKPETSITLLYFAPVTARAKNGKLIRMARSMRRTKTVTKRTTK